MTREEKLKQHSKTLRDVAKAEQELFPNSNWILTRFLIARANFIDYLLGTRTIEGDWIN